MLQLNLYLFLHKIYYINKYFENKSIFICLFAYDFVEIQKL